MLAWRDLADVEAGGSEIHAAKVAERWAEAGLDITMRTSYAQGQPPTGTRDGYRVIRRSGRYAVFPSAIISEILERHGPRDAIVEVWNGVPFLSPIWFRGPKLVVIHHVHHKMWDLVLEPRLARAGRLLEGTIAPPFYRRSQIVTPSHSSRDEVVSLLGMKAGNISVSSPGIDTKFTPGGAKSPNPLLVTVGRLMPPKRFDEMIRIANEVRERHPSLELVVVGDGYERPRLQELVSDLDAHGWVRLAGRVSDDELISLYRRAWAVTSASIAEGFGMTMVESAACGTPAVATRIAGHIDSVSENESGMLASSSREMVDRIDQLLSDHDLRERLSDGARKHAAAFTWDVTAYTTFVPLAREAARLAARTPGQRRRGGARPS